MSLLAVLIQNRKRILLERMYLKVDVIRNTIKTSPYGIMYLLKKFRCSIGQHFLQAIIQGITGWQHPYLQESWEILYPIRKPEPSTAS